MFQLSKKKSRFLNYDLVKKIGCVKNMRSRNYGEDSNLLYDR